MLIHHEQISEYAYSLKESICNSGDPSSTPGSRRSPREGIGYQLQYFQCSLVAQLVKNLPAMWEIWVQSLGWEDPLEKESLPTPVSWPREFHGLYSPWGCKETDMTERLSLHFLDNSFIEWRYSKHKLHAKHSSTCSQDKG